MTIEGRAKIGTMGPCIVLGCGDIGFEVVSRLEKRAVVVVDKRTDYVKHLKLMGYHAVVGDLGSPETLRKAGIEGAKVLVIATPEFSETRRALEAINRAKAELNISPFVLALIPHDCVEVEARRLGANDVVPSTRALADAIVDKLEKLKS